MCFSSTMSSGAIQKSDISMSSSLPYFSTQQVESPYHPISPMSPSFHQQDAPPLAWHSILADDSKGMAPRIYVPSSPVIHSKNSFAPTMNTPVSSDGRTLQYSEGNTQLDPFISFLPPPPNLESSDSSHQIGRQEKARLFPSESHIQPTSPYLSSPTRTGLMNAATSNRDISLSSSGTYIRQPSFTPLSSPPPPSRQILYEDKPFTWSGENDYSMQNSYRECVASSPSTQDRYNSRPPRHFGTKDTQALLSPRVEMRHAASDGNFNIPASMPLASHTSPIANNSHGRYRHNIGQAGFGPSSFDSSVLGGQLNDRHLFGSMDTL